jgi:hypothetical protein
VTLTGANSAFSLSANQSIGSLSGGADTNVLFGTGPILTTGNDSTSTSFAGDLGIDGNGALFKLGTGMVGGSRLDQRCKAGLTS